MGFMTSCFKTAAFFDILWSHCVQIVDLLDWVRLVNRKSKFVVFLFIIPEQMGWVQKLTDKDVHGLTGVDLITVRKHGRELMPMPNKMRSRDTEYGVRLKSCRSSFSCIIVIESWHHCCVHD